MIGVEKVSAGAAGLVLATSVVILGATVTNAVRVAEPGAGPERLPAAVAPGSDSAADRGSEHLGPYPRVTQDELLDAVNQDLFQPGRLPPPERYQLPGERVAGPVDQADPRRRRGPVLRVVGSAVMGEMALALIQVDDSVPLAVLLGESVEGYTLASVDQESATLTSLTETLTLPVVEPLMTGRSPGEAVQIQVDPRNIEQFRGRMQEVLRRQMTNRGGGGQP